jgi:hypothetical protein
MPIPRPLRAAIAATALALALVSCGDDDGAKVTDIGDDGTGSPSEPVDPGGSEPADSGSSSEPASDDTGG